MSDEAMTPVWAPEKRAPAEQQPGWMAYGLTVGLVAVTAVLAFVVDHLMAAPNVTLVFVLPVVLAATYFGWRHAALAAVLGVATFDFFFTQPYYSFRIHDASDVWAAALLLVIATIVSAVSAQARGRAIEARVAADQADALRALAHRLVAGNGKPAILDEAATALSRIFAAPAVVLMERAGRLQVAATSAEAGLNDAAHEAAAGALQTRAHVRAETYPFDQSTFDFWPVVHGDRRLVLGVDFTRSVRERPAQPERFVEIVAGYLTR